MFGLGMKREKSSLKDIEKRKEEERVRVFHWVTVIGRLVTVMLGERIRA